MTIFRSWPFDIFDSLANDKRIHVCLELLQSFFTALLCCIYWGCLVFLAYFCRTKHQSARFSKVIVFRLFWQPTSLIHKLRGIHYPSQPAPWPSPQLTGKNRSKEKCQRIWSTSSPGQVTQFVRLYFTRESHLIDKAVTLEPHGLNRCRVFVLYVISASPF